MQVNVWAEQVIIPTYQVGMPDKNPMFLEKRVYQGSSGKVYPHTVIDTVSDEKTDQTYQAVYLENEYLKIMVLPELGGRIQRATDKTNGYDFVYYNQVIKPAMVGLNGPWISGGIEFNWPQHHRPSTFDPVAWRTQEHPDGSASIVVGEIETMFRTRGTTHFTLYPGKAYLEISTQVYNRTDAPQTFLWWANPAVAVNDNTRSIFPPDVHAVMDHGKRDVSAFPIATGVYYKHDYAPGTDISRYRNIPVPTSYMAYHSDYDFVGNYDDGRQAGLLHVADHHIAPGKKQWTWGNGAFGQAWDRNLTDEDGPYIELMTGCFTDNQPDFSWLMPYEQKRFTQVFMPYKQVGQVSDATRDAVLRLSRENGQLHLMVYATGRYQQVQIVVTQGDQTLFTAQADLSPQAAFEAFCPAGPQGGEPTLTVTTREGRVLAHCSLRQMPHQPMPAPATAIPPASEVSSCEELLLFGQHIEQYRHATWDAAAYYLEGLRRDESDLRLNNAYGKLLIKRGLVEQSVPYFDRAIAKLTLKNPNPYDSEPYFNRGVALCYLGRWQEAYDAFFKATWSAAWQGPGFYRIGCIDLMRGEDELALTHLNTALIYNSHNMKARNAKTAALRRLGRLEQAAQVARESIAIDPLDPIARRELGLMIDMEDSQWLSHAQGDHNTIIELALEYMQWGFCEDAAAILKAYCAQVGDEKAVYPLVYYHLGVITGDNTWFSRAQQAIPDGCFPHRLEDCAALEAAISRSEDHSKTQYYLGNFWYDRLQDERAIKAWEASAKADGGYATVHRNLALAYYNKRKQPQLAMASLETAFRLDTSDARVFMERDQLRKKLGIPAKQRLQDCEANWPQVLARDDQYLEYCTLLNMTGQHEKALNALLTRHFHPWEGGEGKVPAQWRLALTQLARQHLATGEAQEALLLLERAAGEYPHSFGEGKLPGAQENDIWYLMGRALQMLQRPHDATSAYTRASLGLSQPVSMMYYNDQPPEMIFYQGLARMRLGDKQGAEERFDRLVAYGEQHLEDKIAIEYFAVSLPDLMIFEEDLCLRNRIHCLFMMALGYVGKADQVHAQAALDALKALCPEHQGAEVHSRLQ